MSYLATEGLDFPLVTVCTYSRANASRMAELDIDNDLLTYLLASFKVLVIN